MSAEEEKISIKINGRKRNFNEASKKEEEMNKDEPFISIEDDKAAKINKEVKEQLEKDKNLDEQNNRPDGYTDDEIEEVLRKINEDETKTTNRKKTEGKEVKIRTIPSRPNKGKRNYFSPVIFAAILALVIGTSFGFAIKKVITANDNVQEVSTDLNKGREKDKDGQDELNDSKNPISASFPVIPLFVIQSGVFSTVEHANDYVANLKETNIPALTITEQDQSFVFIALANSHEEAKAVALNLSNDNLERYAKQFNIKEKQVTNLSESDKSFLEKMLATFPQLVSESGALFLNSGAAGNNREQLLEYLGELSQFQLSTEELSNLQSQLILAIQSLTADKRSISESEFLASQAHLLKVIEIYNSLT